MMKFIIKKCIYVCIYIIEDKISSDEDIKYNFI